jgi:uncharacterized protein (DUF2384 family)
MKNKKYIHKEAVSSLEEPIALYLPKSFEKSTVLEHLTQNSIELFNALVKNTGLTIKILAENIFEITPKTFIKYKNTSSKIPSRIAELAIEINTLYVLGKDVFGSTDTFNNWLNKENPFFNGKQPSEYLNTSTGIHLIYEELKRIEFGATA